MAFNKIKNVAELFDKNHSVMIICGLLSCVVYICLAQQSTAYGDAGLQDLWLAASATGLLSVLAAYSCYCFASSHSSCSTSHSTATFISSQRYSVVIIIGFAIIFRLIALIIFPVLEDDFYRYLWDGRSTLEYGSPYGIAPSLFFSDESVNDVFHRILGHINYPDVATVYGPLLQWVFAAAYLIAPGELWSLKWILGIADIGIIVMLIRWVKIPYLLLYAWCPLIIKEFAISAHPDIIGVAFMLLGVLLLQRQYVYWSAAALACAVASKVFAIIIVPLLLGWHWRRWLVFMVVAVALAMPFGIREAWLPDGLVAMGDSWLFNAPLYVLLQSFWSFSTSKWILLWAFSALWLVIFFRYMWNDMSVTTAAERTITEKAITEKTITERNTLKQSLLPIRGDYLFGLFFLCIPVVNPWYLIWLLPFAAIYPTRWAWVASFSVLLSYNSGINIEGSYLQLYEHSQWVLFIQFGVIGLAGIVDMIYYLKSPKNVSDKY